jgi:hypothetical protein
MFTYRAIAQFFRLGACGKARTDYLSGLDIVLGQDLSGVAANANNVITDSACEVLERMCAFEVYEWIFVAVMTSPHTVVCFIKSDQTTVFDVGIVKARV